jgi:hypothetical protein
VDSLFGDIKQCYVYNFVGNLVVYSSSLQERNIYLKKVFTRLQGAGFTSNRNKNARLAQKEIQFLGHSLLADRIRVLPEMIEVIKNFPSPKNLKVALLLGTALFSIFVT